MVLQEGQDIPLLRASSERKTRFSKTYSEGDFCLLGKISDNTYLTPYMKPPSYPLCWQKSNKSPRTAFSTSETFKWHQDSLIHRAQNSCWPQQALSDLWLSQCRHSEGTEQYGTYPLLTFQISTFSEFPQNSTHRLHMLPKMLVSLWCVSVCCLLKGTQVPYFLPRPTWSPSNVATAKFGTEVIKTELDTVLVPKLFTPGLVPNGSLQRDSWN